jgi:hypothetical protein
MQLSSTEKEMLIKCSAGIISKAELANAIPNKVNYTELLGLLRDACSTNDSSMFEALIWCMPNQLSKDEEEVIFKEFLIEENHFQHENFVTVFQTDFNLNSENTLFLLNLIKNIPNYLQSDDFKYPYIRKIIYAIGAQPEPYNIKALEKLANETTDPQIKDFALHQIEKRKRLGRWEAAKNAR